MGGDGYDATFANSLWPLVVNATIVYLDVILADSETARATQRCPFQGAYHFIYSNNSGGECRSPTSYVTSCASPSHLLWHFRRCANAAYTYERGLQLQSAIRHWYYPVGFVVLRTPTEIKVSGVRVWHPQKCYYLVSYAFAYCRDVCRPKPFQHRCHHSRVELPLSGNSLPRYPTG